MKKENDELKQTITTELNNKQHKIYPQEFTFEIVVIIMLAKNVITQLSQHPVLVLAVCYKYLIEAIVLGQ